MRLSLVVSALCLLALNPCPCTADEKADAINYFLVRAKWTTARMERDMSELTNLDDALAKARRLFNELKTQTLDADDLPLEFRNKYLEMITSTVQLLDEVNTIPRDAWGVIGLGLSNLMDKGKTAEKLKERLTAASDKVKNANEAMEKSALQLGARTDWDVLPRITEVKRDSLAMKNGLRAGDFLYTIDGTKLFRLAPDEVLAKAANDGRQTVEVRALTDRGIRKFEMPAKEQIGATMDLTGAEPTVIIRLKPYLIQSGFYVHVYNYSKDTDLEDVKVTYHDAKGDPRQQKIGTLKAQGMIVLDPHDVHWRVERKESITITAKGRIGKKIVTDRIIP